MSQPRSPLVITRTHDNRTPYAGAKSGGGRGTAISRRKSVHRPAKTGSTKDIHVDREVLGDFSRMRFDEPAPTMDIGQVEYHFLTTAGFVCDALRSGNPGQLDDGRARLSNR
jgi:hypothetical protein